MGWKQAAGLLVIVFVIVLAQSVLAAPLTTLETDLNASGDYSNEHFDGNTLISDAFSSWWDMGLLAMFLAMGVVVAEAVRRELTRQGRP